MWQFIVIAQSQPAGEGSLISMMIPFALIFLVFYFLIIRPERQKHQRHQDFVSKLKKGDKVVTSGGILGKVKKVGDKTVTIETGRGQKLELLRGQIQGSQAELVDGEDADDSGDDKKSDDKDENDDNEKKDEDGADW